MLEMQNKSEILKGVKMLSKSEYKAFSPEQRQRHYENIIRNILENAKSGITISQLEDLTKFDRVTLIKHLERLVAMNIAYRVSYGKTYVYSLNGKLMHAVKKEELDLGSKIYSLFLLENPKGMYVYLQEKKRNEINAIIPSGGILIDAKDFSKVVDFLLTNLKRLEKEVLENEIGNKT